MPRTKILGLGSYVPDRVVDNEELPYLDDQHRRQPTRQTETDDAWIQKRTGIKTRRLQRAWPACGIRCKRDSRR
jgi:3-oxoacyl-[acyl-carrier-protein] synthase III